MFTLNDWSFNQTYLTADQNICFKELRCKITSLIATETSGF